MADTFLMLHIRYCEQEVPWFCISIRRLLGCRFAFLFVYFNANNVGVLHISDAYGCFWVIYNLFMPPCNKEAA